MNFIKTKLPGVVVVEPKIFGDHRGWFMETYSKREFVDAGIIVDFVQDNQSMSKVKGTLRGLHFQHNPKAQTKLVRCTKGAIYDVAVDIRQGSPTFGQWFGIELTAENKKQILIPQGFAHGFMTLTDDAEVQYKCDNLYSPEHECGILWNDPEIRIEWPQDVANIISEKDKKAPLLKDVETCFIYEG